MNSERWQRLQTLFHQAVELPKDTREAFLESECGPGDHDLVAQVLEMIEEDERASSPFDRSLADRARQAISIGGLPAQVGPYLLGRQLGYGGMGVVYLAHHKELGSTVAIKFLRDAWMSPARAQRFCAEQRTLAKLNHPSIARLYEAGTLAGGIPWFAMEYVEGIPLTEYCRQRNLGLVQRLTLFRSVCQAVEYAHSLAVIHRDLKPSNILVKEDTTLRLLDFGIAKQLEPDEPSARQTFTGLHLFTPAYASPEQIRGESIGVFTDAYSLGVILYELLTGQLPVDTSSRPSLTPLSTLHCSRSDWDELNVICAAAMHPDVSRRYSSARAVIRDIDHLMKREPLEARPDSLRYRTGKFLARNRNIVSTLAAMLTVLAILATYFTVRLNSARRTASVSASRTERVEQFMLDLFNSGDSSAGPSKDLRAVTLLDRGVKQADSLGNEPAIQAQLYRTLGSTYQHLGKLDRAETLLHLSLDTSKRSQASDNQLADGLVALGLLRVEQGKSHEAEDLIRDGLTRAGQSNPRDSRLIARATAALGKAIVAQSEYSRAVPVLENAIQMQAGPPSPGLAASMRDLAGAKFFLSDYDACDSLTKRAMAMHVQLFGASHPSVADDWIDIGNVQQQRARYLESEVSFRKALGIYEGWYGPDHPEVASSLTILSQSLSMQKRLVESQKLLDRALTIQEHAYGPLHPRVAFILNQLGSLDLVEGRYNEAADYYQRTLTIYRSFFGEKSAFTCVALANLATVYFKQNDYRQVGSNVS